MPYKDPEKQKEYQVRHGRVRMRRKRLEYIEHYGGRCVECGNDDIRVLEFHHRERGTKTRRTVSWTYSKAKILEELDGCDLLCSNCHSIREWYFHYPEEKQG